MCILACIGKRSEKCYSSPALLCNGWSLNCCYEAHSPLAIVIFIICGNLEAALSMQGRWTGQMGENKHRLPSTHLPIIFYIVGYSNLVALLGHSCMLYVM